MRRGFLAATCWHARVSLLAAALATGTAEVRAQQSPAQSDSNEYALPTAVEAVTVRTAAASEELRVVGSLLAGESVVVRPEVAGRIASISFNEGEAVRAGQELFTLEAAEYRAQVASSEAAAKLLELKFARARDLLERRVMSQQEYDEAQEALKVAKARLELERVRLDKTVIRAPFAGTVGLRQVSPGDYVQPGQALVNLEAINPIKVEFTIPERYSASIRSGQPISLAVAPFPERKFQGEVYAIDPKLDPAAHTVRLRGRLGNPEGALRPGMFSHVTLTLAVRNDALWVPEQALVPLGNGLFVFRILDNRAVLTPVKLGVRRGGLVEVLSGVNAGDRVVTAGQFRLQDGTEVRVVEGPAQVTSALQQ